MSKKQKSLGAVIRAALVRELIKMQDNEMYGVTHPKLINNWDGEALASWVAPGVIALLEGGTISRSDRAAQRIIKVCKDESQRRLRDYDRHVAAAQWNELRGLARFVDNAAPKKRARLSDAKHGVVI